MRAELASYYRLGNRFAHAIGHPWLMQYATRYGLPRRTLLYRMDRLNISPADV